MIVRDEEAHLAACLDSVAPVVDEVVIVDTGSTDATPAIARRYGAVVVEQPWQGDFSRARNAGLDLARGRWILYIDADERLRPVARSDVAARLESADEIAFRLLLRPYVGYTPYREYRMWRNDPRIRFEGMMHEKVIPAIHAAGEADGRPVGLLDLEIDHVGYEGDQTRKHRRNLPLLEAELDREPGNVFNWWHLGHVRCALGDRAGGRVALEHAVALTRAGVGGIHGGQAMAELAVLLHEGGEPVDALLDEARERFPGNWRLVWIRACVDRDAGRHLAALEGFDRLSRVDVNALGTDEMAYDARMFGAFAHESRGVCLFRLGRHPEAAAAFAEAERLEPGRPEHAVRRRLAESRA